MSTFINEKVGKYVHQKQITEIIPFPKMMIT